MMSRTTGVANESDALAKQLLDSLKLTPKEREFAEKIAPQLLRQAMDFYGQLRDQGEDPGINAVFAALLEAAIRSPRSPDAPLF